MTVRVSEQEFERAIELAVLQNSPDAVDVRMAIREPVAPYGDNALPGGYLRRSSRDYDSAPCLIPSDVTDFLLATQPEEWQRLRQHYGAEVKARFLARLSREIGRRGALDVLRNGVKDWGQAHDAIDGLASYAAQIHFGKVQKA